MENTCEELFLDFEKFLEENSDKDTTYLFFANHLHTLLKQELEESKYSEKDLLNYPYVLEYLQYNPQEEILILAHTMHSLLFLYQQSNKKK